MGTESGGAVEPRTIKASEFKANCFRLMDEVAESGRRNRYHEERASGLAADAIHAEIEELVRRRPGHNPDS